ncbi:hypothetical protein ACHAW6_001200, partial [Cyclotella cf. meneghiniana]
LDGRLHAAIRGLTLCNGGSVLGPNDTCTKTGHQVRDILVEKHPALQIPDLSDPNNLAFSNKGKAPGIIPIDCPLSDAERVACQLKGSTGCSGVDAEHLKNQLLKHGKASAEQQEEMVEWALWLANTTPTWAAYRAMRQGCLREPLIPPRKTPSPWTTRRSTSSPTPEMDSVSSAEWQCCGKRNIDSPRAHALRTTSTVTNVDLSYADHPAPSQRSF